MSKERQKMHAAKDDGGKRRVQERTRMLRETNKLLQAEIADRKRAEEAVRIERQRLYDVLETLPAYVVLLSKDYHVPFANRFFRERFGESHGKRCFEYLFNRTEVCENCETYTVLKTNAPHRWEWTGPDGRIYDIYDFPFTDTDGSPLIMEMGIDITERKQAEDALKVANETLERRVAERTAALREAHERAGWLARFPEENPNPVARVSADGRILYRNPPAAEVPGWAFQVSQPLPDALMPLLGKAMNEGQEAQQDVELEGRFYFVSVAPFPSERYANIYGYDITDRKQAEEALLRAKQEWERTFDAVPDLIAILDDRHRILRANKAMAQRLGLPPDQCAGKPCYQVIHGLGRAPDFCPHSLTLADGQEHVSEVHEDCLGGDFLVSTTPLSDERGRRIGSVHVARDITGRKLREERIAQLTKLYAVLSRVNETIVRTHEEEPLFVEVCRIVAEEGGFPLIWIGQVKGRQVAPVAWHGPASEYLKEVRVEVDGELGIGPTGTCIREDRPVINDDFDSNPSTAPWREPALRYGFRASAGFPLHRQGRVVGALTLYAPKPGAFDAEQVKLLEALCADISYALDAVQQEKLRTEAEQTLRENEERLRLLSETAGRLLVAENPQGIVNDLCRDVMAHLDCQAFLNFLVDEGVGRLHLNAYAGIPEEEARKVEWLDYGVAVSGCVAQEGHPIVAEDIRNTPDPRTEMLKSYGVQAYACHPLMVQGQLIGTLAFGTQNRPNFRPKELALMRTVTDQVATAMERMMLIQELQRSRDRLEVRVQERTSELARTNEMLRRLSKRLLSAQEEERKRIAGELHDSIGACLSGIKFRVEKALQQIGGTESAAAESLSTIIPVIQEAVEECRRIQMDLRPSMLDDLGLRATLSWFCRGFQKIYSEIQVDQEIDVEEGDIPSPLKIVAFRVIQEAMNNVAKHSQASHVRLRLRKLEGRMELIIQDSGRGFKVGKGPSQDPAARGLGLLSMRERTELSGGSFAIESAEGKGTIIRASWPLGKE
jgi:PAS domain S-box-containing protein